MFLKINGSNWKNTEADSTQLPNKSPYPASPLIISIAQCPLFKFFELGKLELKKKNWALSLAFTKPCLHTNTRKKLMSWFQEKGSYQTTEKIFWCKRNSKYRDWPWLTANNTLSDILSDSSRKNVSKARCTVCDQ